MKGEGVKIEESRGGGRRERVSHSLLHSSVLTCALEGFGLSNCRNKNAYLKGTHNAVAPQDVELP